LKKENKGGKNISNELLTNKRSLSENKPSSKCFVAGIEDKSRTGQSSKLFRRTMRMFLQKILLCSVYTARRLGTSDTGVHIVPAGSAAMADILRSCVQQIHVLEYFDTRGTQPGGITLNGGMRQYL
jgi:hypothetical protein